MKSFLIFLTLVLLAPPALAASVSEMLANCRAIAKADLSGDKVKFSPDFKTGMCWGAFLAIQGAIVQGDQENQPLLHVCAPAESTTHQLVAIFVNYAERSPQRFHEDFFPVAIDALWQSFPCKPGQ